jgi:phage terminase large subunit-like protein
MATATSPRSRRRSSTAGPQPERTQVLTRGYDVIRWIELHCVFTNNQWIGQPARLLPWEKEYLLELFRVGGDGLRQYRWSYTSVGKKNGKTEIGGWLGAYLLVGDGEPAARIGCCAAGEDQADLIFSAVATNFEMSPTLSQVADVQRGGGVITIPSRPGTRLERVAASGGVNDGPSWHALLLDELHEWVRDIHRQTWTVLTNGLGARRQPLVAQFTTAGYDLETLCGEQYEYAKRVRDGSLSDPRYHVFIREAPPQAKWRSVAAVKAANPSYGVIQRWDFYKDQQTKKRQNEYRRYYLNQWTEAETVWISEEEWVKCLAPDLDLSPDLPVYVGIDVSRRYDASAVVVCQRVDGRWVLRTRIWENPHRPGTPSFRSWTVPHGEIRAHLIRIAEEFPASAAEIDGRPHPGPAFGYDPNFFIESSDTLAEDYGLNMVEHPQTDARMQPASQALYELITTGALAHDGDAGLRRHLKNVEPKELPRGFRISKPRGSRKKIDAAVAAAIAVFLAKTPAPTRTRSVYETRGLEVIG